MTEQEKKRQVAKISVFITSIFVIFLSISYAFINQTLTGSKRQVITSGNIELELKEGDTITLSNALPMYDEVGMIQDPFTFKLINKTSSATNYTLKLVDITSKDTQKLDTSVVKYSLEKDGTLTKDLLSSLTDGIIDSGTLAGNKTINYNLRLWIDSSVEDEKLIKDKSLSYRIDVVATQVKEVIYKGMIRETRLDSIDDYGRPQCSSSELDDYCEWTTRINSIVFENQINVPEEIEEDKKWDLSVLNDGSVMGYLEEYGTSYFGVGYKLHIQGNGKIYANVNSKGMFGNFDFSEADAGIAGLEYLDTSQVTNMSRMFSSYSSSQPLDLSTLDTSNVTDMSYMFSSYSGSQPLDLSGLDTSNVTNMSGMFDSYSSSQPLNLNNLDTSKVTNMNRMFFDYNGGALTIGDWNTSNVTDMSFMFYKYSGSVALNLASFDTENVTDMSSMFSDYSSSEPLDLSSFDTSNVTNMSEMFSKYRSSEPLDLSNFNTSNVKNMSKMFKWYEGGALTIGDWNTSNVTDMSYMFSSYSGSQPLDLSSFDTSNVTNMSEMFSSYRSSEPLDLSSFDTSNVTNMSGMFDEYDSDASLDISSFDFSKVTKYEHIFYSRFNYHADRQILVKDEAMKNWVLEQNSNLTNVTIKGA